MVDLHPDELLERPDGELSSAERSHVERHLSVCPACRLERRARSDFRRLVETHDIDAAALVARVLRPDAAGRRPLPLRTVSARSALLIAALLAIGGVAAAANTWSVRRAGRSRAQEVPATLALASGASARTTGGSTSPLLTPAADAVPISAPPDPAPRTSIGQPRSHAAIATPSPSLAEHPARDGEVTRPLPMSIPEDEATLFQNANTARRRGDHATAAALYRRLLAAHPQSIEARESVELLGRMLFDDGMSSDALACFKEYLRRGGELAAEAMLGKALALQQLGQTEEERAAWTALLEAYPESPHAERARLRLAILRDPW